MQSSDATKVCIAPVSHAVKMAKASVFLWGRLGGRFATHTCDIIVDSFLMGTEFPSFFVFARDFGSIMRFRSQNWVSTMIFCHADTSQASWSRVYGWSRSSWTLVGCLTDAMTKFPTYNHDDHFPSHAAYCGNQAHFASGGGATCQPPWRQKALFNGGILHLLFYLVRSHGSAYKDSATPHISIFLIASVRTCFEPSQSGWLNEIQQIYFNLPFSLHL